jgi:hypothetical protein
MEHPLQDSELEMHPSSRTQLSSLHNLSTHHSPQFSDMQEMPTRYPDMPPAPLICHLGDRQEEMVHDILSPKKSQFDLEVLENAIEMDGDKGISDRSSEITFESSLGGSSVVSISQMSTTAIPKMPSPTAFFPDSKVRDMLHPKLKARYRQKPGRAKIVDPISLKPKEDELNDELIFGGFSVKQIRETFAFIGPDGQSTAKPYVPTYSLEALDAAFRKVKRARKQRMMEEEARKFMKTFRFLLQLSNKSPEEWFVETDTTPDCKLSWSEFETGMQKLCTDLGGAMFSKNGLLGMLRYMDPFCNGELTAPEVKEAFKRIKLPSVSVVIITEAGVVFSFLQKFIQKRAVRVQDLFNLLDAERNKKISLKTFCVGIERLQALLSAGGLMVENRGVDVVAQHNIRAFDPILGDGYNSTMSSFAMNPHSGSLSTISDNSSMPSGIMNPFYPQNGSLLSAQISQASLTNLFGCPRQLKPSASLIDDSAEASVAEQLVKSPRKRRAKIKSSHPTSRVKNLPVDSVALQERRRLLNGITLPGIPPPLKVNYQV